MASSQKSKKSFVVDYKGEASDTMKTLSEKLEMVKGEQRAESLIFRVHETLRQVNQGGYDPKILSIGPYHHGKSSLKMMESHKLRYLKLLLEKKGEELLTKFFDEITPLEKTVTKLYVESLKSFSPNDNLVEMLVLDGCFIIELVRKFDMRYLVEPNDPVFKLPRIMNSVQRDLLLLENQIPFFILEKLFGLIETPNEVRLVNLLLNFFGNVLPDQSVKWNSDHYYSDKPLKILEGESMIESSISEDHSVDTDIPEDDPVDIDMPEDNAVEIDSPEEHQVDIDSPEEHQVDIDIPEDHSVKHRLIHLVDFIHRHWLPSGSKPTYTDDYDDSNNWDQRKNLLDLAGGEYPNQILSATELGYARVRIVKTKRKYKSLFDITFKLGTLKIPPFYVDDKTESVLLNLIAYEQFCNTNRPSFVTDYVTFLTFLINSANDVAILRKCGVIENLLGDDQVVADIFDRISSIVSQPSYGFLYSEVFKKLNHHCNSRLHRCLVKVLRFYFDSNNRLVIMYLVVVTLLALIVAKFFK